MNHLKSIISIFLCTTAITSVFAQAGRPSSIALLPLINSSGDKWQELKDRQVKAGEEYLQKELSARNFVITDMDKVLATLKERNIDLTDEEVQKKDTFFAIGAKLHVDYVLFAVITDTRQHVNTGFFASTREGFAKVKVWLLDIKEHRAVLSAGVNEARASSGGLFATQKGSDAQVSAVPRALAAILKDFLKGHAASSKLKTK